DAVAFNQALRRHNVVLATQQRKTAPENTDRRKALISQLEDEGWRLTPTRAHLEMAGPEPTFMDFMMSLIGFDVRGVQEGDHNRQRNIFICVPSNSPSGTELLRGNTDLARALANYICPPDTREPNVVTLQDSVRVAFKKLPIDWTDNRIRVLQRAAPLPGELLVIKSADGVTIGHDNVQRTKLKIEVEKVRVKAPKIPQRAPLPIPQRVKVKQPVPRSRW